MIEANMSGDLRIEDVRDNELDRKFGSEFEYSEQRKQ